LFWGAWAACLPAIQRTTGASTTEIGLALLTVAFGALPAMLGAGRLADLFGARLVPIGLVCFGVTAALPGLAQSVTTLVIFLLLVGLATGFLDIAINAQASWLEAEYSIRIMDGLHAAFSGGVLVGGVGAGLLRRAGAHPSWILGGVAFIAALTALANLGPVQPRTATAASRRFVIARPLLLVGFVLALAFLVESGVEGWSALFLERTLGTNPAVSGLGPGLFAGAMLTGRLLAQRLQRTSVVGRMLLAGVAAAIGTTLVATSQHAALALLGFVVAGGGLALSAPTLYGLAGRLGGEGGRGSALSTVAILGYLGFLVGPALIGGVSGLTSLRGGFVFLGVVAVLLAASSVLLRRVSGETGA
jgi:MFS family permease